MIVAMFKKQCYFAINIITFVLITLGTLYAADNQRDLDYAVTFRAFSSEISQSSIGTNIFEIVRTAQKSIIIASDKCTNEEFLGNVLKLQDQIPELTIDVVIGDDNNNASILWTDKYKSIRRKSIPKNQNGGKMHNKFIVVDDRIVITGSPNLTKAAYNSNIESFVSIESQHIAALYRTYYGYIIDQTNSKKLAVLELMNSWNDRQNIPIQICLAPLVSISAFITQRLNAAKIVNINMFLISRATEPDGDIISHLSQLGGEITVNIDKNQYDNQDFMKIATRVLTESGARVSTVSKSKSLFHDKLMLIEYQDGSKRVIIGSAGFTTNVQDNLNFENMVSINDDATYVFLLEHFNSIQTRKGLQVAALERFPVDIPK